MPAVTVDNILVLPRVAPAPGSVARPTTKVVTALSTFGRRGLPGRRPFPAKSPCRRPTRSCCSTRWGRSSTPRGSQGHTVAPLTVGFETVTYIMDGAFEHRDSTGGGGLITNGDTQWMTAGSGLLHIETPPEIAGHEWRVVPRCSVVGQSAARPEDGPALAGYQDLASSEVSLLSSADGGALIRVIAGELEGIRVRATPTADHLRPCDHLGRGTDRGAVAHGLQRPGLRLSAPAPGPTTLRSPRARWPYSAPATTTIAAAARQDQRAPDLDVLLLGGRPINQPIFHYGPFVMNTRRRSHPGSREDFQAGRMGVIPPEAR